MGVFKEKEGKSRYREMTKVADKTQAKSSVLDDH